MLNKNYFQAVAELDKNSRQNVGEFTQLLRERKIMRLLPYHRKLQTLYHKVHRTFTGQPKITLRLM